MKQEKVLSITIIISLLIGLFIMFYGKFQVNSNNMASEEVSLIEQDEYEGGNKKIYNFLKEKGYTNINEFLGTHLQEVNMTFGDTIKYLFRDGSYIILDYNTYEVIDNNF
ncbi:hypothetical protein ACLIA0_04095 [Bacillaceae bacterium W0354]